MKNEKMGKMLTIAVFCLVAGNAFAEKEKRNSETPVPPANQTQKFSGLRLKGELKKPELTYTYRTQGTALQSLVVVPDSLDERVVKSAADL